MLDQVFVNPNHHDIQESNLLDFITNMKMNDLSGALRKIKSIY